MPAETIFALSSGAPPAAIAVVRVSGPAAGTALAALAGDLPVARRAVRRRLRDAAGATLDDALVLWLPGPGTATGEDIAELHLHGGRAVVAAVSMALAALPTVRLAEPGEFTRRALFNGRIDVAQAEGLADLLAAETEAQRRVAMRVAEGGVSREVAGWLARLTDIAAIVEAEFDYSDDLAPHETGDVRGWIAALVVEIDEALRRPPVERLRDGVRVVLAGPPNSGKSSLINALLQRDVSIVAPIAGTTRDVVEATVVRDGRVFVFADTAGLAEHSNDPIEQVGISRAQERIATSDVLLWLGDDAPPSDAIWLYPRADARATGHYPERLSCSIQWPATLDEIWQRLLVASPLPSDDHILFNARQRDCVSEAATALRTTTEQDDPILVAEALRQARRALSQVLGYDQVESVLDALFARFCVGK